MPGAPHPAFWCHLLCPGLGELQLLGYSTILHPCTCFVRVFTRAPWVFPPGTPFGSTISDSDPAAKGRPHPGALPFISGSLAWRDASAAGRECVGSGRGCPSPQVGAQNVGCPNHQHLCPKQPGHLAVGEFCDWSWLLLLAF